MSYFADGSMRQFTYGNSITHTVAQNARQLTDLRQDSYGGVSIFSEGYDYDQAGNLAAVSDGGAGRNQRGNRTMQYDGMDRLIQTVSPMFGTASYTYDALDNVSQANISSGPRSRNYSYCYDSFGRLTNLKTGGCAGTTVGGVGYDDQGNVVNKNGQEFVFDLTNRLREAKSKEKYRYDGLGRRVLASAASGDISSMYDVNGTLRFQKDLRQRKAVDYITLNGELIAEAEWPASTIAAYKDQVSWAPAAGAVQYVVEESADGVTWTTVYQGNGATWTSLGRPKGSFTYRVLACTADGVCTAIGITHAQRPAFNIVPMLYQLLFN